MSGLGELGGGDGVGQPLRFLLTKYSFVVPFDPEHLSYVSCEEFVTIARGVTSESVAM